MRRKQITYARKRNKNRAIVPRESRSSPLEDISDPEQYLTHPEMARRALKRSRRSGSTSTSRNISKVHTHGHGAKKPRTSPPEANEQEGGPIFPLNDKISMCTPYPTQSTEDQVFKLESSRGLPLSPDHEFSPVPIMPARRSFISAPNSIPTQIAHKNTKHNTGSLLHRTSSRSLKENMSTQSAFQSAQKSATSTTGNSSRRTRSRSKAHVSRLALASPFTSQPSSPHKRASQNLYTQPITKPTSIHRVNITTVNFKRTLSDIHYNPNLPQTQSTANSPARSAREAEGVKARRPSAPSSTSHRPDVASWIINTNISQSNKGDTAKSASSFDVVRSPTLFDLKGGNGGGGLNVDFNRPPSQLSFTSAYDENFFGDAWGVSTPFSLKGHKNLQVYEDADPLGLDSSEDEDEYRYLNNYVGHQFGDPDTNEVQPLTEYSERGHSTWITDSLISPPTAFGAYNQSKYKDSNTDGFPNVQMLDEDDEITLGLGPSLRFDPGPCFEDTLLSYGNGQCTNREEDKPADLKELFEGLEIAYAGSSARPMLARSRSLDLDPLLSPPQSPANKDIARIQPLESPAYISPSKAKLLNANPGPSTDANKRGIRDRRGTIRASDFPPAPAGSEDVALLGGARRTRSGTVIGPARNKRERSGTVSAAARPIGLSTVTRALDRAVGGPNTEGMDIDKSMQRPDPADADVPMSDDNCENEQAGFDGDREDYDAVEMDPMNIVNCWRDEDWPWTVAEPPSPVRSRRVRAKNRKRGRGIGIELKLPKRLELWQMREHDADDGEDDPLDLLR